MPESETIQIDEVVTNAEASGAGSSSRNKTHKAADHSGMPEGSAQDVFSSFQKSLPLKARILLKLTQWLMFLRSKKWGKWLIAPAIILGLLLAIPAALFFVLILILRSAFSPLKR